MHMPAISVPRYTIADLENFPEDGNRYELLDGVLLVTPQANLRHQTVASLLMQELAKHVGAAAWVLGPAAVEQGDATHLEPDVLVFPRRFSPDLKWRDVDDHWLVIEILSRSSRIYDRDFKRDAYLAIGAREVWIVDPVGGFVEVSRKPGRFDRVDTVIRWRLPDSDQIPPVDIAALFAQLKT
jgi:Uma2 family endonuclease